MSDVWRIFVVVGEDVLNQNIVNSLLKDGYAVRGVMSGADAVRVLWAEEYDIVICDLKTPGADGFELLQWLRMYRPSTRMIMLGEANSPTLRMQALESGVVSYFERPIDLRLLREELRRLLQQTGFTASLDSFDLLDVIQIITLGRKNMALLINTGLEERGILCFQNGELVWAEYGVLRGEEAFFALAAHKNGTVTQQPWNEQIDANVTQPLSRLIFQALQYRTKYADRQQYSGEIESVPQTSFSPFSEIDDTPFMVLTEHEPSESPPFLPKNGELPESAYPYPQANAPMSGSSVDQQAGFSGNGNLDRAGWDSARQTAFQPERFPAVNPDDASLAPTMAIDSSELNALLQRQKESQAPVAPTTSVSQSTSLPDWLTDHSTISPSQAMFPMDVAPVEPNAFMPTTPGEHVQPDEWYQPQPFQTTTDPLPSRSADNHLMRNGLQETDMLRRSSSDWRASAQTPAVEPQQFSSPSSPSYTDYTADHADANLDHRRSSLAQDSDGSGRRLASDSTENPMLSTSSVRAQQAAQRNYPALMNALQTLGYAVPGFIAAALVTSEGHAIAQVTVDDEDRAAIYQYIGTLLTQTVQMMEHSQWGAFEHTVVSSVNFQLVIRGVSAEKKVFHVLIVARDTDPAVCLETMANVEGSISAALR